MTARVTHRKCPDEMMNPKVKAAWLVILVGGIIIVWFTVGIVLTHFILKFW